jgi:LacI family transcriptional regulator
MTQDVGSGGDQTRDAVPRRPDKAPTIIDVAKRAHASKSTVSNVLQGKIYVREQTRTRVLEAMAELGYRPNVAARNLRQRPRVLGVLVGDLRNPFHAEIAALIEQQATAAQHTILLATTGGQATQESERVEALIEHRVAAVLFGAFSGDRAVLRNIPEDVPRVFVSFRGRGGTSISVDEARGARLAVEHLVSLGHKRIAYVSTTLGHEQQTDKARYAGYLSTLETHGIDVGAVPSLRLEGQADASTDTVLATLTQFLYTEPRPTAVFAASDFTAIEVIEAADLAGLRVPADLSVVGFDDIAISRLSRISLTTIAQPMGELAARAVQRALAPPTARRARNVLLAPQLVVRNSTARSLATDERKAAVARRMRRRNGPLPSPSST